MRKDIGVGLVLVLRSYTASMRGFLVAKYVLSTLDRLRKLVGKEVTEVR